MTTLPTSFSSLPEDIVLNCLARVSKYRRPTLIASPDLEATRSRNGIKEEDLCVCFDVQANDPRWFTLVPFPTQQKLKGIHSYYKHPDSCTVISIGSEIYIIGGLVKYGKKGNRVLVLDCESHQWRRLPNMRLCRKSPAADVIDGKIYVIGGSNSHKIENWGEVYDPETKIWEPLLPKTVLDLTTRKSVVPGKLVMGGKVYDMDGLKLNLNTNVCLVEIENMMYQISISDGMLVWCDLEESLELSRKLLIARGNFDFDECKTEIWCAEISFERRDLGRLWGLVEWSKNMFIFDQDEYHPDFFLHSAIVTY
ncbi:PREDICTED: putative F-box/kelch-repeat protein At5g03000 [Camelina sativa]|uniref:F-box/kelch-repeat protein At5g03000 n=1 Tax=Camelina sativa TaxID=90675 RepID=A0ABM0XSD8_CAMSA|nr:PREDICTED: putative F-box/kelch-repeat protein At5g03000 [Camelina sativa]